MANPADQRVHKRLQTRVKVEFKLIGSSAAVQNMPFREAMTRDISAGGVFIELFNTHLTPQNESVVDDFLLFKSQILMKILIPSKEIPITAKGKSVWIEKEVPGREYRHGIAISFTEIADEDRSFIDAFVLSRV
jgi:hypothetical protein